MKIIVTIILIVLSNFVNSFGQNSIKDYQDILENNEIETEIVNNFSEIIKYDLSKLWEEQNHALIVGFIGANYKRMDIRFLSVSRNPEKMMNI